VLADPTFITRAVWLRPSESVHRWELNFQALAVIRVVLDVLANR
jgi:hypothetical protein